MNFILNFWNRIFEEKKYKLVFYNGNAFFVREDILKNIFKKYARNSGSDDEDDELYHMHHVNVDNNNLDKAEKMKQYNVFFYRQS